MNISRSTAFCKPSSATLTSILSNSNSVPHVWYHKILYKTGKPDNVRIIILAELLQLHLNTGKIELQPGCAYLQNKFNYTYDQVYEALVGLEKQTLISRKGKTIIFNAENVLALSTEQKDNDNNTPKKADTFIDNNTKDSSLNIDLYIDIKEDIEDKREENYISGTSFDDKPNTDENTPETKPAGIIKTARKWVKNLTKTPIAKFHPLTEEDAESLRLSSGREFNLHFINQLVLRLGEKYPNHSFYTKKLFMKYLSLTLANEMRQAVNVNNEGFRFKRTDDEEGVAEAYLARVEHDYGIKASDQIRRKVAASFEPIVAYKILTSCYFPEEVTKGKYEIRQRTAFELSASQRDRLYSQVSAVFGDSVRHIAITNSYTVVKKAQSSTAKSLQAVADTTTLWGRIRSSLIAHYGEAIDKSWFSRLETTEDARSRSLILKGASFLTDYIQTNYSHVIERLCREENYQLKFC